MSLVINTNTAASIASTNLQRSNSMLQKSLNRLSSGTKITSPADDAGGLAVSMKMGSAIRRTGAVDSNVTDAISFLQTQDGSLSTATKVLDRISELKILNEDPTKSASDRANYQTEFKALQAQLTLLKAEKFNGVDLFIASGSSVNVVTTETGGGIVAISQSDLSGAVTDGATDIANTSNTLGDITITNVVNAIQSIATLRASNGAETSQLLFSKELLSVNKTNLEAANSRILDTDVAEESTQFARWSILTQSGTAMLSQANAVPQTALRLLQ